MTASPAYQRFAQWVAWLALLSSAVGIWIGVGAVITNGRQDAQRAAEAEVRDKQQAGLLRCFDRFAEELAGSLPPVREASAARDEAVAQRDTALQQVISLIVRNATRPPADEQSAREAFIAAATRLRDAGRGLTAAQENLQQARDENPYPEPPSTFCTIEDD